MGYQWKLSYNIGSVQAGKYQLSFTVRGDPRYVMRAVTFTVTLQDTVPPQTYQYYYANALGLVQYAWTESVMTIFTFNSSSSNVTFSAENTDSTVRKYGIWLDTFYLTPETSPGSGIFANYIAQVNTLDCPMPHPYPYARVGSGFYDSPSFIDFDDHNCESVTNGGFTTIQIDQETLTFRGRNIYGSTELTPGNYSVTIFSKIDTNANLFPVSVDFLRFDGSIFARFSDVNLTGISTSWSEISFGTLNVTELITTWSIKIYSTDNTTNKIGMWFDTLYVTPANVINVINVGNNLVCNSFLDQECASYDPITNQYEISLAKPKDIANRDSFIIFKSDCSSFSNGKHDIIVNWVSGLYWFYQTYPTQISLEPNTYAVSITFRYEPIWNDPVEPFSFFFQDSITDQRIADDITWPNDKGVNFTSDWTQAVIGTITISQRSGPWRLVIQNLDTEVIKPNRFYFDTVYIFPVSQPNATITRASECPQTNETYLLDGLSFNLTNSENFATESIIVMVNFTSLVRHTVDVTMNVFSHSSSKRNSPNAVYVGVCIINGVSCVIIIPEFSLLPDTYDVQFELASLNFNYTSEIQELVVTKGNLNIDIELLPAQDYVYNSRGSITINIERAAVGSNITLTWMCQDFLILDWIVSGDRARATVSTLISEVGNSTVTVTYANEPYYAPQVAKVDIFIQKAATVLSWSISSDFTLITLSGPTNATGDIALYRDNLVGFTCTLTSGSCSIAAEKIAGLHNYSAYYAGDNFFRNSSTSFSITFNSPPIFRLTNFTFQNNASDLHIGEVVTFTISFRDPDSTDAHTVHFNYGDNTTTSADLEALQNIITVSHIYTSPGKYRVRCVLTDGKATVNYTFPLLNVTSIDVPEFNGGSGHSQLAVPLAIVGACILLVAVGLLLFVFRKKIIFSKFRKISASMGKAQKSEIDPDEVVMHEKLGSGGHSDVYRATYRGTEVAVKILNAHYFTNASSLSRFEFEVAIMCGLRHPNIILFMGQYLCDYSAMFPPPTPDPSLPLDSPSSSAHSSISSASPSTSTTHSFTVTTSPQSSPKSLTKTMTPNFFRITPNGKSKSFLNTKPNEPKRNACIVMEYMCKSSLCDLFAKERVAANCTTSYDINFHLSIRFPDFLLFHIAYSVANGLSFLHQCKPAVIHRDIKTANILVDEKWNIKISDFGITSLLSEDKTDNSVIGTMAYIAPELLTGESVSEKTDIYSFGFVLWEMFHYGADPFYQYNDGLSIALALRSGFRPAINSSVMPPIADLITQCWAHNPGDRPNSMRSVCRVLKDLVTSHPFVHQKINLPGEIGSAPESGTLYYVFTDIEGSSDLWESLPFAMGDALKLHNLILRHNAHVWRGYEVRFEGDSYFAVFTSVIDAIMFCVYSQRDLLEASWSQNLFCHPLTEIVYNESNEIVFRGLRVRMGINMGESKAEVNPVFHRMDYFGTAVNKAARMLSLTQGGQIFVTAAVANEYANAVATAEPINTINAPSLDYNLSSLSTLSTLSIINSPPSGVVKDYSIATTLEIGEFKMKGFKSLEVVHEVISTLYPRRKYVSPLFIDSPSFVASSAAASASSVSTATLSNKRTNNLSGSSDSLTYADYSGSDDWNDVIGEDLTIHIPFSDIRMERLLCTSPSGAYYKATWHSSPVTAKVPVTPTILAESDFLTFKVEVMTLSKLSHDNIVHYYGGCLDRANVCLVMEYLPYGNLHDFITQRKAVLSYMDKLNLLLEVASGLEYLHSKQVIHRDLKPANLMMCENNHIKISNFGVSKVKEAARTTVYKGEVAWTAPELLLNKSYSEKVDIYSFGMIMFCLQTCQMPYETMDVIESAQAIINGILPFVPSGCPKAYEDLMGKCWQQPDSRPSSSQLCEMLKDIIANEKQHRIQMK